MSEYKIAQMPKEVATAIVNVMREFGSLRKTENNTHGNYRYAPIDDFYEKAQGLFAKYGLIIIPSEISSDVIEVQGSKQNKWKQQNKEDEKQTNTWVRTTYCFYISHESGATWENAPTTTVMVMASMGSQSSGAALSYAIKNLFRSTFNIATGETEIDATEAGTIPSGLKPVGSAAPRATTQPVSESQSVSEPVQDEDVNAAKQCLARVMNAANPQEIVKVVGEVDTLIKTERYRAMVKNAADIRESIMLMDDTDKYPEVEAKLEGCLHSGIKPKLVAEAKAKLTELFAEP